MGGGGGGIGQVIGEAVGGVGGLLLGGPAGAAIGANLVGGVMGASAAQGAASAQQQAASNALTAQQQQRQQAFGAAQPSFGQLQAIQQQYTNSSNLLNTQLTQLQSQYSLYQSASSQAQALMSGQAASALAPVQQQQQLQRQQLQQSLEQQYGPGYATTTAGSMALANFDMQTQLATSQIQGQYTSMYLGAASSLGANYTQGLNSAYGTAANINQSGINSANQLQTLGVQALNGNQPNYAPSIQTAGAQYAGQAYLSNSIGNSAGQMLGYLSKNNNTNNNTGQTSNNVNTAAGAPLGSISDTYQLPAMGSSAGYGTGTGPLVTAGTSLGY